MNDSHEDSIAISELAFWENQDEEVDFFGEPVGGFYRPPRRLGRQHIDNRLKPEPIERCADKCSYCAQCRWAALYGK